MSADQPEDETTATYPTARTCPFDPPAEFTRLRALPGLPRTRALENARPWLITRYEDTKAALASPAFSARLDSPGFPLFSPGDVQQRDDRVESLIRSDDPDHLTRRRRLTRHFTVKRVHAMREEIQQVIDSTLDDLLDAGSPADLVVLVARPVPARVICLLLGVPYADHAFFQQAAARALAGDAGPTDVRIALRELGDYLDVLVQEKARTSGDDVLTQLARDLLLPGTVDRAELVNIAMTLLVAGFETTGNKIGLGTALFLRHPGQRDLFMSGDEALGANAVEELLRYLSVAQHPRQLAVRSEVTVAGCPLSPGDGVLIPLPSANRDPQEFDSPDAFDIGRTARGHLAFSHGTHQCLGQALARLELLLTFRTLFARVPTLRLADSSEGFDVNARSRVHGFNSLQVAW
ncbi:cytochrome P450 [Streptomyces sp. NBC_00264]|uniref:cytochrome P450 n=1 Tax=unclassified Streptomyces TaxID=2593676 RepID=UPI002252777D|nr:MULTISPECIES: cytochrome P450 [unclassified Streptomyces]MCX5157940.1 cytochrome P450 [Streptomyces sp. NBC_00305]MCX5216463.1 cytochrome P450 [Streptomyces sp. NBC_00264]